MHLVLLKNGNFLATNMQNYDASSSVPVTVQTTAALEKGDTVLVERRNWYDKPLWMTADSNDNANLEKSSYFTGFLLPNIVPNNVGYIYFLKFSKCI